MYCEAPNGRGALRLPSCSYHCVLWPSTKLLLALIVLLMATLVFTVTLVFTATVVLTKNGNVLMASRNGSPTGAVLLVLLVGGGGGGGGSAALLLANWLLRLS